MNSNQFFKFFGLHKIELHKIKLHKITSPTGKIFKLCESKPIPNQPRKPGYWRTKDGVDILYADLTDDHLLNIKDHLAGRAASLVVVMDAIAVEINRRGLDIKEQEDDDCADFLNDEHWPEHF
jgi:hypothetical protein